MCSRALRAPPVDRGCPPVTTPHRGFLEGVPPVTAPHRVFFGGCPTGHRTALGFETGFLLFFNNFFFKFRRATGEGMAKKQAASVSSEEVLQVESKCSFLPIYPTYDQYVHRFMTMPQREGFHVFTRSDMKELRDHVKWFVLHDNHKKRVLFTVRVDVWHRSSQCGLQRW